MSQGIRKLKKENWKTPYQYDNQNIVRMTPSPSPFRSEISLLLWFWKANYYLKSEWQWIWAGNVHPVHVQFEYCNRNWINDEEPMYFALYRPVSIDTYLKVPSKCMWQTFIECPIQLCKWKKMCDCLFFRYFGRLFYILFFSRVFDDNWICIEFDWMLLIAINSYRYLNLSYRFCVVVVVVMWVFQSCVFWIWFDPSYLWMFVPNLNIIYFVVGSSLCVFYFSLSFDSGLLSHF